MAWGGSDFDQPDSSAVYGGGGRTGAQGGLGGFQADDRANQFDVGGQNILETDLQRADREQLARYLAMTPEERRRAAARAKIQSGLPKTADIRDFIQNPFVKRQKVQKTTDARLEEHKQNQIEKAKNREIDARIKTAAARAGGTILNQPGEMIRDIVEDVTAAFEALKTGVVETIDLVTGKTSLADLFGFGDEESKVTKALREEDEKYKRPKKVREETRPPAEEMLLRGMSMIPVIGPVSTITGGIVDFKMGLDQDNFVAANSKFADIEEAKAAAAAGDQQAAQLVGDAIEYSNELMAEQGRLDRAEQEKRDLNVELGDDLQPLATNNLPVQQPTPPPPQSDAIADFLAEISGRVDNPFGDTEEGLAEFSNVLGSGFDDLLGQLGPDPADSAIDALFSDPDIGQIILDQERSNRQQGFRDEVGTAFPGDAFTLDNSIIDSIVNERAEAKSKSIAGSQARGNLSEAGVLAANEDLTSQIPDVTERISQAGQGILGQSQADVNAIRDTALQGITGYNLGDDAFDVTPFATQRQDLIDERAGTFGEDVRETLGISPFFNLDQSLLSGSRSQGVVSGARPNTALLDTIAERERGGTRTVDRRGLGTRGSGAF